MPGRVDQVMVQRLGGWNLVSVEDFLKLDLDEQRSLVVAGGVQFLGDGQPVDAAEAMAQFAAPFAAEVPSTPVPTVIEWPPADVRQPTYTISRVVVAGPRWEVQRESMSGTSVPLAELRRPDEFDPYDLEQADGVDRLSHDLVAMSLGIDGDARIVVGGVAVDDFRDHVFRQRLGNRAWRITTAQVRTLLAERPHVRFVAPAAV